MTDTALYADVVLPATTFLEGYDFAKAYGPITHATSASRSIDAVGEARSNADVFGELCARLGLLDDGRADRRARPDACSVLDALPATIGDDLRDGAPPTPPFGAGADSVRRRVPEHAGSQGRSVSRRARRERADGPVPLPARSGDRALSAGADLAGQRADDQLDARRAAAARRQAARCIRTMRPRAGWRTAIWCGSSTISAKCTARCTSRRRSARARSACRKGCGGAARATASPARRSCPDTLTDLGGGACFNDARVQVASLPTA